MKKTLIHFVLGAVMAFAGAAEAKKKDKDNPSNGGLPPGQAKKQKRGSTTVYVQAPQREVVVVTPPQRQVVVVAPPPPRVVVTVPRPPSVVLTAPSVTVTH